MEAGGDRCPRALLGGRVHDWDAEGSIVSYLQEAAHGSWLEEALLGPRSFQRMGSGSPELEEGPRPAAELSEADREQRPPGPHEWTPEAGSTFSLQVKVGALGQGLPDTPLGGPGPLVSDPCREWFLSFSSFCLPTCRPP